MPGHTPNTVSVVSTPPLCFPALSIGRRLLHALAALFAVILLEVLHTTVIFLHGRSRRAIVRAFLVVAILSIVRKMLPAGAELSLTGEMGPPFVPVAAGILLLIGGILLLVGGLVLVTRTGKNSP